MAEFSVFWAFQGFSEALCESLRQVKKQQIEVKFWIWGPRTVYCNMSCAQILFYKSLHPNIQYIYFQLINWTTLAKSLHPNLCSAYAVHILSVNQLSYLGKIPPR